MSSRYRWQCWLCFGLWCLPERLGVTSIYEILEVRIGRRARLTAAGCFLLFRGVATAVTIYGSALVISLLLDLSFVAAVLLIMTATLLYDYFGGLTAVVISDVIQLALLLSAVVFSLIYIGDLIDWNFFVEERKQTLVNDWGFNGQDYGFWPMLIGGIFFTPLTTAAIRARLSVFWRPAVKRIPPGCYCGTAFFDSRLFCFTVFWVLGWPHCLPKTQPLLIRCQQRAAEKKI